MQTESSTRHPQPSSFHFSRTRHREWFAAARVSLNGFRVRGSSLWFRRERRKISARAAVGTPLLPGNRRAKPRRRRAKERARATHRFGVKPEIHERQSSFPKRTFFVCDRGRSGNRRNRCRLAGARPGKPEPGNDRAARFAARSDCPQGRPGRTAGGRLRLVRGAGLESPRRLSALLRRSSEHGVQISARARGKRLSQA